MILAGWALKPSYTLPLFVMSWVSIVAQLLGMTLKGKGNSTRGFMPIC